MSRLSVAIVGAGPSGLYAAGALGELAPGSTVDLFERLPTPFGLVRYGVAPDSRRREQLLAPLRAVLASGVARLRGGVEAGVDVTVDELREHYDAVVIATGANRDAPFELAGSFGAAEFVAWYGGHPDAPRAWPLDATSVAVVGAGNVALDVTRMLVKRPPPETHARDALAANPVRDLHLIVRRGPADVRFSPELLRELTELDDVDVLVDPADLAPDPHLERMSRQFRPVRQVLETLHALASRPPSGSRRVHLRFYRAPVAVTGAVLRTEKTIPDGYGPAHASGEYEDIPAEAVYRAVGYAVTPPPGVPFDQVRGAVPHLAGAVTGAPGLYVTGWAKRGCTGLVGASAFDARQTVETLLRGPRGKGGTVDGLLDARGIRPIGWDGWLRIEAAERERGTRITDRAELTDVARS